MKIDELPVEMLMKIFGYVHNYGEVSLVNNMFYAIACQVNNSNICLRINNRFYKKLISNKPSNVKRFQSIQASTRPISKVQIEGSASQYFVITDKPQIIAVLRKFSATIKLLKMIYVTTNESTFCEILSVTPNIDNLYLYGLRFNFERQSSGRPLCNDDLNLRKLKSLKYIGCNKEFLGILSRLPAGVLTEMEIHCHWNTLNAILNRQFNIKKLTLLSYLREDDKFSANLLDKLKLDYLLLRLTNSNSATIATILSEQTKLRTLQLFEAVTVDERVLNVIANNLDLEVLGMNITEIPIETFVKIQNLRGLRDLSLRCENSAAEIEAFTEWNNSLIKNVTLIWCYGMSVDRIGALAKSLPNLTHLNVSRTNVFDGFDTAEQDAILSHFNFIEAMEISICNKPPLDASRYFNPKLKELLVINVDTGSRNVLWLSTLMAAYPNLRSLTVIVSNLLLEIRWLLDGFKKLDSLIIETMGGKLVVDDLSYLCERKPNIKYVSLKDFEKAALTNDLAEKLCTNFDIVNIFEGNTLEIAVDRHSVRHVHKPILKPHPLLRTYFQ